MYKSILQQIFLVLLFLSTGLSGFSQNKFDDDRLETIAHMSESLTTENVESVMTRFGAVAMEHTNELGLKTYMFKWRTDKIFFFVFEGKERTPIAVKLYKPHVTGEVETCIDELKKKGFTISNYKSKGTKYKICKKDTYQFVLSDEKESGKYFFMIVHPKYDARIML
ncbi:hypothetical protein DBR32_07645 [Taibaiella sp. KBW10]|uniref:hypothetical protein n=1 Tax=Taibaiella sp. KBW10 TaxID=2153357 RepID=UPI000F5A42C0|nr:hypothetical protein [Taibaiella sp. KBW10]RQO31805.1 hypothetical protein DBR32_07645 [Taibaiella sp. KBW10]